MLIAGWRVQGGGEVITVGMPLNKNLTSVANDLQVSASKPGEF